MGETVSFNDRSMKDHPQRSINHVILLHAEHLLISEISNHLDRFRLQSMLHQDMVFNGVMYSDDAIRERGAQALLPKQQLIEEAPFPALELGGESFSHGVMDIQQHLCAHQLGYNSTEDQKVRHVVHVDDNIPPLKKKKGGFEQTPDEKLQIGQ